MAKLREHPFSWTRYNTDGLVGTHCAAPCLPPLPFPIKISPPWYAAIDHPLPVSWTREVPHPIFLPLCQKSGRRVQATMKRLRLSFYCRAPPSTSPLTHGPRPGGRPMRSFALLHSVSPRGSIDSPSLRSTGMALFLSSAPSSAS